MTGRESLIAARDPDVFERYEKALRHIADMPDAISRPAWEAQARWLKAVAWSALNLDVEFEETPDA